MIRSGLCFAFAAALAMTAASGAWARGPGSGGPPAWAGGGAHGFAAGGNGFSGETPPGWSSRGQRRGWFDGRPRGFGKGRKRGWHRGTLSGSVPPGWQR